MRRMLFPTQIRALHRLLSRSLLVAALQRTQQAAIRPTKLRRRSGPSALERHGAVACTESHCGCPRYIVAKLTIAV